MFVFRYEDIPADPFFPADLERLGYFVNEHDQIRMISNPDLGFQFKINKNDRWNEVQREAMNECIRNIVHERLCDLGLFPLRLPLTSRPDEPRTQIMVSRNISTASRVIIVFGEPMQDLGIFAYRSIGGEDGIESGSAVALARALHGQDPDHHGDTALILANTGQLVWHCGERKAMTLQSWIASPRPTAAHAPMTMTFRNKIPGHADWQEHVASVFDEVLAARGQLLREDVKIDIIGLADGGLGVIRYLEKNWDSWRPYISAICLSNPLHNTHVDFTEGDEMEGPSTFSFAAFVSSRCRAYVLSDQPLGFPVSSANVHGCNCYSSGEALHIECIMPKGWRHMLEWLDTAYADTNYAEAELEIREVNGDEVESVAENGGVELHDLK
ncbi:hypothetical protein FE257_003211 [Aspergillus nanangensis]|uniref:Arb2 domain-containing protein n=1 Tax=Aspergillus nanangensis TaxID=2582783 RepID=A0AAD4GWJ1_ASPNN|nr:hypothetical protein FE257_003211 [Aspergillus nanangensis]